MFIGENVFIGKNMFFCDNIYFVSQAMLPSGPGEGDESKRTL